MPLALRQILEQQYAVTRIHHERDKSAVSAGTKFALSICEMLNCSNKADKGHHHMLLYS